MLRVFRAPLRSALALTCAALLTDPLLAELSDLALDWNAPAECPTQSDVLREVEQLLGGARRRARGEQIAAVVHVRSDSASSWSAELQTADQGRRTLRGESCAAIASATAIVLALAIDPEALSRARESTPARDAAEPLRPERSSLKPSSPEPSPRGRSEHVAAPPRHSPAEPAPAAYGRLFLAGAFGLLPEISASGGIGLGLRYRAFSAEVAGAWTVPRERQHERLPEVRVEVGLSSGSVVGCFSPLALPTALDLCFGAELESISASAQGVTEPGEGRATLGAGLVVLRARQRIERSFSVALELAGTARPHHPEFVIDGVGTVHDIPLLAAAAGAGIVLDL